MNCTKEQEERNVMAAVKKGFNQDLWMYETMCEIVGVEPDDQPLFTDRYKFFKVYRKATFEQRMAFFQRTKLAEERSQSEIERRVRICDDQPFQVLPAENQSRADDIEYFVVPRID